MDKEKPKKILDKLQKTIDKFTETTGISPHALVCNKKTYEAIAQEMCKLGIWREYDKVIPSAMSFEEIPILKNNGAPSNKIYAIDKETYEEIMNIAKPTSSGDKA